ncbi:MAG: phosphatidylglycerophosphatase A [Candidatus Kapabacteria bacterium]|jgi:phosphatidylglycerophosphatase A|nr:phosphatidylglycerophosphatase A [Candidatus Kapabacteria bacterium]
MLTNPSPLDRIKIGIATLGNIGFVPKIPGTVGSFAALLLAGAVHYAVGMERAGYVLLGATGIGVMLGLWAVPLMETHWGDDPSCVVIDELVGMWTVLAFVELMPMFLKIPSHLVWWSLGAFVLFRVFDIAKPFPISQLNEQKGAFFVIVDDLVAGIFASVGLLLIWLIWQLLGN